MTYFCLATCMVGIGAIYLLGKIKVLKRELSGKKREMEKLKEQMQEQELLCDKYCRESAEYVMDSKEAINTLSLQIQHLTLLNIDLHAKQSKLSMEKIILEGREKTLLEDRNILITQGNKWITVNKSLLKLAKHLLGILKDISENQAIEIKCESYLFNQQLDTLLSNLNILRNQSENLHNSHNGQKGEKEE